MTYEYIALLGALRDLVKCAKDGGYNSAEEYLLAVHGFDIRSLLKREETIDE